jgi:hypothetical protein
LRYKTCMLHSTVVNVDIQMGRATKSGRNILQTIGTRVTVEFLGTIDANKRVSDGAPVMDLEAHKAASNSIVNSIEMG